MTRQQKYPDKGKEMEYATFRQIKEASGLTLASLAETLGIPLRTCENWNTGVSTPPSYVLALIVHRLNSLGYLKEDG